MGDSVFRDLAMRQYQAKRHGRHALAAELGAKLDAYQAGCSHPGFQLQRAREASPTKGVEIGDSLKVCARCNKLMEVRKAH